MGNCSGRLSGEKPVKVIGSDGGLKLIPSPVTAAELMMDSPGYAVALVESLRQTRRVTAEKADAVLVSGEAYLLAPVDRIGSWVSDSQLAVVEAMVYGGRKKKTTGKGLRKGGSKVLPEVINDGEDCEKVKGFEGQKLAGVGGGCRRLRIGRAWTPVLEPILESC